MGLLLPSGLKQAVTVGDLFPEIYDSDLGTRVKTTFETNLHLFKAKAEVASQDISNEVRDALQRVLEGRLGDPLELFGRTMSKVAELQPDASIVVFIDELDRLQDKARVGDLIKHSTGIRFVLVGVSETGRRLIGDHESVIRKIDEVYVPPLGREETSEIFENASKCVESLSLEYQMTFSSDFIDMVYEDSGGYPYLSQRFGYHAVNEGRYNRGIFERDIEVDVDDYKSAVKAMFGRRRPGSSIEVGTQVREAVGDSTRREAIVREFVNHPTIWINVTDVLGDLKKSQRVDFDDNIDTLVAGGVLERSEDRPYHVKFSSPIVGGEVVIG